MKQKRGRIYAGAAIVLLAIVGLGLWQWKNVARAIVNVAAVSIAKVHLSFAEISLSPSRAVLDGVVVTSLSNEPIADIGRLSVTYDLHDLLPGGGKRLYGLKSITAESPHVTIVRHPDGTYNVPNPQVPTGNRAQPAPMILQARVRDGSIEVRNESRNAPASQRRLFARNVTADADISSATRSTYTASLDYGERPNRLYPVRGRGDINVAGAYIDQRWTAAQLPIAAAVNFFVDSPVLRVDAGMLHGADVRFYGLPDQSNKLQQHLAASATLGSGRISLQGLAVPVEGLSGTFDAYDNGLLTPKLTATLAGTPAIVSGGIYDLAQPHLRLVVKGAGDLARMRVAFAQARSLPMHGPLAFSLLVQGRAAKPLIWVDLRSPSVTYASTPIDRLGGFVAFDGSEADLVDFTGDYRASALAARGRVALVKRPNAIEVLAGAHAPPGAIPYANQLLPRLPLDAVALATAQNPKEITLRGLLWGATAKQQVDAAFDVDGRGVGTIGPLHVREGPGSLYARVALDRPHGLIVGLARVNDYRLLQAHATLSATLFGGQSKTTYALTGIADASTQWGRAQAQARVASIANELHGGFSGRAGGQASFVASVAGTPQKPRLTGSVVVAGGRYRDFDVNGAAAVGFAGDTLHLRDAALALGPLFVAASGTVTNLLPGGTFVPRYELAAELHSSDVSSLVAQVQPRAAPLVAGSVDAKVDVHGSGAHPSFAGTVNAPEGSLNGLAFRNFHGSVDGGSNAVSIRAARVVVGSTALALSGAATTRGDAHVAVSAPRADLADFNDLFDAGDVLAGTGSVDLSASTHGMQLLASRGTLNLTGARYRQLALGDVSADWHSAGKRIATNVSLGGPTGTLRASGSVMPSVMSANITAHARNVDLATWLPMLGYVVPVTGRLDADASLSGSYPDLSMDVRAVVANATAGRLPVQKFDISASATHGRGTIRSASVELPSLSATASGTFGLRESDRLALVASITSPNVGAFLDAASGKASGVTGTLASTLHVEGTRAQPHVRDELTLQSLQRGNLTIPRVYGVIDADRRSVALRNGEIDLVHGRALLAAEAPILLRRSGIAVGAGGISATVTADDIELSNFAQLLPKDTQLAGRIDGSVVASGSIDAPQLQGSLALRDGAFSGPMEKSPVTGLAGQLAFAGTHATLESHATVGGGAITAQGTASVSDLRNPAAAAFNLQARADNARLDLPNYFTGNVNGSVSLAHMVADAPLLSGDVALSKARIPIDAFLSAKGGDSSKAALPDVEFSNLRVSVGSDVRVQSKNVDIGATGDLAINGTLAAPSLDGTFSSTGGSLSFYRSFNLQSGKVTFSPSSGFVPDVDAVATTYVSNPPTAISLKVRGPATNMNLTLDSDPSYSREQILGLLVGAQQFGAVRGVNSTGGTGFSATGVATQVALGQLNTLFTRNLLQPLSSSVAGTLGFTEVQITSDIQTGIGINAVKRLGKNVNAVYSQTFGYPRTQAVTFEANPSVGTGYRLSWYTTVGPTLFVLQGSQPAATDVLNLNRMTQLPPPTGTNGINLQYLRKFP
ncbi:MAG TPA: translocation/assembly module TamB domain-containing protein [Candidatus Cybelea sp.]